MVRLVAGAYVNGFYTKSFINSTAYQYIGFTINKVIGGVNSDMINISELQLFGYEQTTPFINPIYISSNVIPNILLPYDRIIDRTNSINSLSNILSTDRINSVNLTSNVVSADINSLSNIISINTNNLLNSLSNIITNNYNCNIIPYATSNAVKNIIIQDTPQVCKHSGMYITVQTPIGINGVTFYKYDLNLSPYTSLGYIQIGPGSLDPYRIFRISACYSNMYFGTLINGLPDSITAHIFMSYKANGSGIGVTGLNIFCLDNKNNYNLNSIPINNLFFLRNGGNDINYITIVSKSIGDIRIFIEDLIG